MQLVGKIYLSPLFPVSERGIMYEWHQKLATQSWRGGSESQCEVCWQCPWCTGPSGQLSDDWYWMITDFCMAEHQYVLSWGTIYSESINWATLSWTIDEDTRCLGPELSLHLFFLFFVSSKYFVYILNNWNHNFVLFLFFFFIFAMFFYYEGWII